MKRVLILVFIFSASLLAQGGFEANIIFPLGLGIGINYYSLKSDATNMKVVESFDKKIKQNEKTPYGGFDTGVYVHLGYRLPIAKTMSFSFLFETGYAHDTISYAKKVGTKDRLSYTSMEFESMIFGLAPKFNWGKLTFGISGGIKVPLGGKSSSSSVDYSINTTKRNIEYLSAFDMKDIFEIPIIPYIRLSTDYILFSDSKMELFVGGYLGYDFGMTFIKSDFSDGGLRKHINQTISSFDLGVQVGVKILNSTSSQKKSKRR